MAFEFYKRMAGGVAPIKELPGKASEVIVKGDPVNLESGLLCVGAAADTAIVGIANESVTPTAAQEAVEVILAYPDVVFKVDFTNAGTKKTMANADIGTGFDLLSTDNGVLDPDDTTGGMWMLVGYDNTNLKAFVVLNQEAAAVIIGGGPDAIA